MSQRSEWLTSSVGVLPTSQVRKPIEIWSLSIDFAKQSQGVYIPKVVYHAIRTPCYLVLWVILLQVKYITYVNNNNLFLFIEMHVVTWCKLCSLVKVDSLWLWEFLVTFFNHHFPVNHKICNETNNIVNKCRVFKIMRSQGGTTHVVI